MYICSFYFNFFKYPWHALGPSNISSQQFFLFSVVSPYIFFQMEHTLPFCYRMNAITSVSYEIGEQLVECVFHFEKTKVSYEIGDSSQCVVCVVENINPSLGKRILPKQYIRQRSYSTHSLILPFGVNFAFGKRVVCESRQKSFRKGTYPSL